MEPVKQSIAEVRQMIDAGVSIQTAIKEALSKNGLGSITAFAEAHQLNPSAVRNHLGGLVRATDETVAALMAELGGTADEWRELLWMAAKPAVSV
jgi:predicted ArsR family transcriptional regulator